MDKKSKILIALLIVFSMASIGFSYYRTMIKRDFTITESDASADASTTDSTTAATSTE